MSALTWVQAEIRSLSHKIALGLLQTEWKRTQMLEICLNESVIYSSFILNRWRVVFFPSGLCACIVLHTPVWRKPAAFRLPELLLILLAYPNPITSAFLAESGNVSVNHVWKLFKSSGRVSSLFKCVLLQWVFFSITKKIPYSLACVSFVVCACSF